MKFEVDVIYDKHLWYALWGSQVWSCCDIWYYCDVVKFEVVVVYDMHGEVVKFEVVLFFIIC